MASLPNNPFAEEFKHPFAGQLPAPSVSIPNQREAHERLGSMNGLRQGRAEGQSFWCMAAVETGVSLPPFAEPIAKHGWRVFAPDLPGFGLTVPAPPGFDWDYAEWPKVVAEIANAQSAPVVLMGLSLGGMTAVFAAQQAGNVAGVIRNDLARCNRWSKASSRLRAGHGSAVSAYEA